MLGTQWIWAALIGAAGLAAGIAYALAARRARTARPAAFIPRPPRLPALAAAGVFLAVTLAGGYALHSLNGPEAAQRRAAAAAEETFRATPLLRALAEADPPRAETLRNSYIAALMETEARPAEKQAAADPPREVLLRQASREALILAMDRLANATDEAAARLAEALLASLRALNSPAGDARQPGDPLLCLGLLHPATAPDSELTSTALDRLPASTRKQLDTALALVLASSTLRPQAAPLPSRADAALADMFLETLPAFQDAYGGQQEVRALFEALADPAQSRAIAPERLCSFAQDLLRALLRMHPEQRGDGLRRLLGAG